MSKFQDFTILYEKPMARSNYLDWVLADGEYLVPALWVSHIWFNRRVSLDIT